MEERCDRRSHAVCKLLSALPCIDKVKSRQLKIVAISYNVYHWFAASIEVAIERRTPHGYDVRRKRLDHRRRSLA
jgi:hypothetical protein